METDKKMNIKLIRVSRGKNSTLSHLYIAGLFCCYLLEDAIRENKIAGSTCIPEGNYELKLNTVAGMNSVYRNRYPQLHKGMVEIGSIQTFSLVFIHIGNYHSDTAGCPLTGHYWQKVNGDFQVMQSTFAYQQVYPKLLDQIKAGNTGIEVINKLM